jgi:hypothetical protein
LIPFGALVILLGLLCTPAQAGRSDWREMTAGHFHIFSTASDSRTREFAARLQAFEETALQVIHAGAPLPDLPTLIYLVSERDFHRYLASNPGWQGFFTTGQSGSVIVVNADVPFEIDATIILHEYTHFIQRNTSTLNFPPLVHRRLCRTAQFRDIREGPAGSWPGAARDPLRHVAMDRGRSDTRSEEDGSRVSSGALGSRVLCRILGTRAFAAVR